MPEENDPPLTPPPDDPTELGDARSPEGGPETIKMSWAQRGEKPGSGPGNWQPPPLGQTAQLFPGYEVIQLLGRGGMGAVYQARQVQLDRLVAIKLLPIEISADPNFADRFRREARAMARLHHPNIITVFDFGTTAEGHLYFVMEYVDGANLADVIRGSGLNPEQALSITEQICTALAFAHGRGVVHRDIKPANVMIDTESHVKVADFGLARLTDATAEPLGYTVTGTVMGTLNYMAPEQMNSMDVDHRADIYSLGVMLYEMLCGEVPKGIFEPPSQRTGCDPRLDEIVIKAMQQAPGRRFQTTAEMKTAVVAARTPTETLAVSGPTQFVEVRPVAAPPALALPEADDANAKALARRRSRKKSNTPLYATIAGMVVVAIGGGLYLARSGGNRSSVSAILPGAGGAAATPAPLENWLPLYDHPENHGFNQPTIMQDGWILKRPGAQFSTRFTPEVMRDGAVRAEFRWAETGINSLALRSRVGDASYELSRRRDGIRLEYVERANSKTELLQGYPAPELKPGDTYRLELRAVGNVLTAKLDGREVMRAEDSRVKEGSVKIVFTEAGGVRNIEMLNLDQGRAGARPSEALPPPVPAKWVDVMPGLRRTMNNGFFDVDGDWLVSKSGQQLGGDWTLRDFTNVAMRVRYRKAFHFKMRAFAPEDGGGSYGFIVADKATIYFGDPRTRERVELASAALPPDYQPDAEHVAVAVAYDDMLLLWIDERLILAARDGRRPHGTTSATTVAAGVSFKNLEYGELTAPLSPALIAAAFPAGKSAPVAPSSASAPAIKSAPVPAPVVNSLGMKFVPVPGTDILMCIHETRRRDYAAYAAATPGVDETWKAPAVEGKPIIQDDNHPVLSVSWEDATAFCAWLSKKEGRTYRLPTDHEWNLAVATDIADPKAITPADLAKKLEGQFPWGALDPLKAGNYRGPEDGFEDTAPAMSLLPNSLGIYDLGGNVWEWTADWMDGKKKEHPIRGGGFLNYGPPRKSSWRLGAEPNFRAMPDGDHNRRTVGFRCVLKASAVQGNAAALERWMDLHDDPAWSNGSSLLKPVPEGWLVTDQGRTLFTKGPQRDGAVRIRGTWSPENTVDLIARRADGARSHYQSGIYPEGDRVSLKRMAELGGDLVPFATINRKLPQPLQPGEEFLLELRAVGDLLTVRLQGTVLLEVRDAALTKGDFGLGSGKKGASQILRSIEYLSLDAPETKATAPAFTPIPSTEAWRSVFSDPFFTGKTSVSIAGESAVFTKPANHSLAKGPAPDGAIRIRAHFQPAAFQDFRLVARRSEIGHYQTGLMADGKTVLLQCLRYTTFSPAAEQKLTPLATPIAEGAPVELELRAVGPKLIVRVNGQVVVEATDATWASGGFGMSSGVKQGTLTADAIEVLDLGGAGK